MEGGRPRAAHLQEVTKRGGSVCGRRVFQTLSGWRSAVRSFPGEAISHPDAGCMESSGQCWGCSVLGGPGGGNGAEASRVE